MLTAMMVSVLLIGTSFTTFWVATQAWEKARRRSEMIRLLEGTADLITRHLRAIQPPFLDGNPAFIHINDGDDEGDYDSVCFLSSSNPRFPRQLNFADLCEIEFYIETGTNGEQTGGAAAESANGQTGERSSAASAAGTDQANGGLWLRVDPTPDDYLEGDGYRMELGAQITSLDFRFFDGFEWLEDWFDDTQVPEAIEFSLTIADPLNRENPMTLTRLVMISMAKAINEGLLVGSAQASSGQPGSSTGDTPTGSSPATGTTGGPSSGGSSQAPSSGSPTTR